MSMYDLGHPRAVDVKAGATVYICRCGRTNTPPYCDGSHKTTSAEPLAYTANKDETLYICGCGKTGNKPFCDGSHKK